MPKRIVGKIIKRPRSEPILFPKSGCYGGLFFQSRSRFNTTKSFDLFPLEKNSWSEVGIVCDEEISH